MSSPNVWTDARARIETVAAGLNLPVAWPNEAFAEPQPFDDNGQPSIWMAVEIEGDVSQPIEIGDGVWDESGVVHMTLFIPTGTGITAGLAMRKSVSLAFRNLPAGTVLYRDMVLDPGGPGETDGRWRSLGLRVVYSYQDVLIP